MSLLMASTTRGRRAGTTRRGEGGFTIVELVVAIALLAIVIAPLGRVFWAWISDSITRRAAFVVMFLLQVVLFWILPGLASAGLLTVIAFVILMCYGGGFGTMPALAADYFGSKNVGSIYGLMLTAWGFASVFGPLLIAHMRQASGSYRGALHVIAGVMLVSIVLPLIMSPPGSAGTQDGTRVREREDQKAA